MHRRARSTNAQNVLFALILRQGAATPMCLNDEEEICKSVNCEGDLSGQLKSVAHQCGCAA